MFEVVLCSSPAQALMELEKGESAKKSFSVVISDQRMPGMLGTDLLAEVARRSPLVTRVILTAFTETGEILDAINRAEIYRYITKPWDNQELSRSSSNAPSTTGCSCRISSSSGRLVKKTRASNKKSESCLR